MGGIFGVSSSSLRLNLSQLQVDLVQPVAYADYLFGRSSPKIRIILQNLLFTLSEPVSKFLEVHLTTDSSFFFTFPPPCDVLHFVGACLAF
jgi:hypothetical protein